MECNVLIESVETDWDLLPSRITPEMRFTLWSSFWVDSEKGRLFGNSYLYWEIAFGELESVVAKFLDSVLMLHESEEFESPGRPDTGTNFCVVGQYRI